MIYVKCVFIFCLCLIGLKGLKYLLTIFQQEHYSAKKLLKVLYEYYIKKKYNYIYYLEFLIVFCNNIYLYILGIALTFIALLIKDKMIIKLKVTNRIKRFIFTYLIILCLTILISNNLIFIALFFLINPFILIFINFVNSPVEALIKYHYIKKAKRTLKKNKNLVKIAITGSFGKTSTKNILKQILEDKYITLSTPKSYNTLMGLTKTINTSLNNKIEVFICEMGAYRLNEIKQMTKFIKPNIGLITDIGYQHIETFKTLENVKKAKFELINNMSDNTYIITKRDFENFDNSAFSNKNTYFISDKDNYQIYISDISYLNGITKFKLHYKSNVLDISSKLLGKHNVFNICESYLAIQALKNYNINITDLEFINKVRNLKQIEHRLSYELVGSMHIYDDSYNSNQKGFINSIEVLNNQPFKKVIITPGIVDLGKMTKEINESVAEKIKTVFDDIYIIDCYSGRYIYNKLEYLNNIHLVKSFKDAYVDVLCKYKDEEIALLIENDLPDNYLSRRRK